MSEVKGMVLEIQRFSIHDGPGIRTTVFLKGCPLQCKWCHNPESQSSKPILSFIESKCIGCGYCFEHCPNDAHKLLDGRHVIDRSTCTGCGQCTRKCYAKALELVGEQMSAEDVIEIVIRDKPFYGNSGGGLTVSGGEPAAQPLFTEKLLKLAKQSSLHTAVETCGYCKWSFLERIIPFTDIFLFDWKETDSQRHLEYCGVDNSLIRSNLEKLSEAGSEIVLRCPVIPSLNDRDEHFQGIAELYRNLNISAVEIMPYHRLGESKYERFGLSNKTFVSQQPEEETVKSWLQGLKVLGVDKILNFILL